MNKHTVRLFLAGSAVFLATLACSVGSRVAPTASSAPPPTPLPPTLTPAPALPPTDTPSHALAPTDTLAPVVAPTETPVPDVAAILKNNGFDRNTALDSGCATACSAYKNVAVNVIADVYYTNGSFSLLYYAKDKNGKNEQAQIAVITKLLAELYPYPGNLSSDVMTIAGDFPNKIGTNTGAAGYYVWSVSVNALLNVDKTIKQATIYIGVAPAG
jgi:hypothetical protein